MDITGNLNESLAILLIMLVMCSCKTKRASELVILVLNW